MIGLSSGVSPRQPLVDLTNDVFEAPGTPSKGKRRADDFDGNSKRLKLSDEMELVPLSVRRRQLGVYGKLRALRNGDPIVRHLFSLPTISTLETFVSSNKADIFRFQALESNSFLTPPYACSYSNASKRGQASALAVATEQGTVDIINTTQRRDWDPESSRTTLHIHANGVFDVKWSPSDHFIATASGDRTVTITDPSSSTGAALYQLVGHSHTAKCVAWDPRSNDLLVSGGRDGSICLWDLRAKRRGINVHQRPVLTIPFVHEDVPGKAPRKGRVSLTPRSVTSLVYVPDSSHEIISSGAANGILRKWDLRLPVSSPKNTPKKRAAVGPVESSAEDLTTVTYEGEYAGLTSTPTRRARGINSLALGSGPSAGRIFALSKDSRVHTYNVSGAAGIPLGVQQADQAYTHRHMIANSFYVRTSVSPCGRWMATGGVSGSAFLFDVGAGSTDKLVTEGIELRGQEGEVGAVDWAYDALATCADDGTVRVWRPDTETFNECKENPEDAKWDWSWGRR
ncbi:hypothetical protein ACEPAF_6868 [Sanghuangporus sanghuang]